MKSLVINCSVFTLDVPAYILDQEGKKVVETKIRMENLPKLAADFALEHGVEEVYILGANGESGTKVGKTIEEIEAYIKKGGNI